MQKLFQCCHSRKSRNPDVTSKELDSCFRRNDKRTFEGLFFRAKIKLLNFTFLILIFTFLSSCTQLEKSQDRMLVKDTIMSYNKLLIEAAKTGNTEPLKDLLIQREREKLNHWIASWHDSDVYMDGQLKGIKFKNLNISGNEANVITLEDWIYEYRNIKTKQVILPTSDISYEMEYILQRANKEDKKWIIREINIKAEKKKEG